MSNILQAIHALTTSSSNMLDSSGKVSNNRINAVGDSLESHIKDAFSGILGVIDTNSRLQNYSKTFSWTGNSNNPPDFMILGGDAVEVKKLSGSSSTIQLNSSYPKQKLYSDDPKITGACRNSEDWKEKDLLYCIGHVQANTIQSLWMVYGDCFVASSNVYQRVALAISNSILEAGLELNQNTRELARVNKVDPLGITSLRVRGMWLIDHPSRIFADIIIRPLSSEYPINAIMLKSKFDSFPDSDRNKILELQGTNLLIDEINIPSPDNPAKLLQAIHIIGKL